MKQYFDNSKMALLGGFVSWFVPLFVSFFLVDPETKAYLINFWLFKTLMASLLGAVVYFFFNKLIKRHSLNLATANTFVAVNILGDLLVLIAIFKMDLINWLTTIVPIYLVVVYGLFSVMKKRS